MARNKAGGILPIAGLDTSTPAEFIKEVFSPNNQNMEVDEGLLTTRDGTSVVGATMSEAIMDGLSINRKGVYYTYRMGGTKIQYLSGTSAWGDVTLSGATLTADSTYPISFAAPMLSGARIVTASNFKDVILKIMPETQIAAILGGSPPKAKFQIAYGAYMIVAYVISTITRGQRWAWCDTGDPQNWTTGNSGAKDEVIGGDFTGLANFQNFFTLHKEDAIYLGYGVTTSAVFTADRKATPGTIANNSIQELPIGLQVYLAKDGIRLFNGTSSSLIESPVNEQLKDAINGAQLGKIWSTLVKQKNEYWLGVALNSDTHPKTVYKYNYVTKALYKDTRTNITCAFTIPVSGQTFDDVILGDSTGLTYKVDSAKNDDNNVAVSAIWDSKDFIATEHGMFARWQQMDLVAKGDNVTISYSTDSGVTWTAIGTTALDAAFPSDDSPLRVWFDVVSTKIRFRFANATADEGFTIKQFIVYYKNREMSK